MSNMDKKALYIPSKVKINRVKNILFLEGIKDKIEINLPSFINIIEKSNKVYLIAPNKKKAIHGSYHRKLQNFLWGLSTPFKKEIRLVGTGYRVEKKNENLYFKLGFSHEIIIKIPKQIKVYCPKPYRIFVESYDVEKLGQFTSYIRSIRPPEPYKGKGVICGNEVIRRKEGKKV
jgi:large subunit ribosomal protein L6